MNEGTKFGSRGDLYKNQLGNILVGHIKYNRWMDACQKNKTKTSWLYLGGQKRKVYLINHPCSHGFYVDGGLGNGDWVYTSSEPFLICNAGITDYGDTNFVSWHYLVKHDAPTSPTRCLT